MKGLHAARYLNGAEFMGDLQEYDIANNYSTAIGNADPVALSSGTVVRGTAAQPFIGSLVGVRYVQPDGRYKFSSWWPGTTGCSNIKALVAANPEILFRCKMAASVGNITAAIRHARVNFVLNAVDANGNSAVELGAAGGNQMLIHEIVEQTGNELGNPGLLVMAQIASHQSRPYVLL